MIYYIYTIVLNNKNIKLGHTLPYSQGDFKI
jgi:hypothetical protein